MQSCTNPTMLACLVVCKAFDTPSWNYLFIALWEWCFVEQFLSWISALYAQCSATPTYASFTSAYFPIRWDMRQGCFLPPIFLILGLEPLKAAIPANQDIRGIKIAGKHHKLMLFANDILISSPRITPPLYLFRVLTDSGLKPTS